MHKPVQVAGALITGGLLFWPAHAQTPATGAWGVTAAQFSVSALQLRGVRSASGGPAEERLRILAQYTAEDSGAGESGEASESEEEESGSGEPVGTLEPSDTVNEVPVTDKPEPATYAPEQGVTASEAAGRDRPMKFKFATGFDYSSGDYGATEDTEILFIPVSGQVETRSFKFKVTVPWLRIEGPSGVVPGGEVGEAGPVIENSGLGDINASASYKLPPLSGSGPFIDLTAKVKFPTADPEDFLGTGAYDFTGQADIFQAFGDLTLFGTFGYRVVGDPDFPEFTCFDPLDDPIPCDLDNGFLASGGFAYKFNDDFSGGGILDWREASLATAEDPLDVIPYFVWKVHGNWSLQAYGVFGLSEGSPNYGGGLQIIFTLD